MDWEPVELAVVTQADCFRKKSAWTSSLMLSCESDGFTLAAFFLDEKGKSYTWG